MIRKFKVKVDDEVFQIEVEELEKVDASSRETISPVSEPIAPPSIAPMASPQPKTTKIAAAPGIITAPLPGKISTIQVKAGDTLQRGALLLLIEAMKMENELFAPYDCTVKKVFVSVGQMVEMGEQLLEIG
ncbi:MAG: biotin/lipoyl-containing protein [bacterium]